MPFRLSAKNIFLTYPNCSAEKQELFDFLLTTTLGTAEINYLLVAKELHQNGEPHFHALICYSKKIDCRNERFWDFFADQLYHPNAQAARNLADVYTYVKKENDYLETGTLPSDGRPGWESALTANSEETFMQQVRRISPRDFIINYRQLTFYANSIFNKTTWVSKPINSPGVHYPPGVLAWIDEITAHQIRGDPLYRPKSLWLIGPSRTGKTSMARSIGSHLYCSNMWMGELFEDDSWDLCIFDDIISEDEKINWALWKPWIGGQREFTATDKYKKKFKVNPRGRGIIFISNVHYNDMGLTGRQLEYFRVNTKVVLINGNLF